MSLNMTNDPQWQCCTRMYLIPKQMWRLGKLLTPIRPFPAAKKHNICFIWDHRVCVFKEQQMRCVRSIRLFSLGQKWISPLTLFLSKMHHFFRFLITSHYPTWQPFESWWKVAEGPLLSRGMVSLGLSLNVTVLLWKLTASESVFFAHFCPFQRKGHFTPVLFASL